MPAIQSTNPWRSIWWNPRSTVRSLVEANPKADFFFLSFLYGLPMVLNFAQSYSSIEFLPLWAILCLALVISPFVGMIGLSITAYVLYLAGRLLNGQGTFQTVRCALAWSNVPNALTILMWMLLVGMFGTQTFYREFMDAQFTGVQSSILFLVFLVESVAAVWGFVILLKALSEVQVFSIWKALINVLLPIFALFVFFWLAALFF